MIETITHEQHWKDHSSYYIMTKDGVGMVRVTDEGNELEISDLFVRKEDRQKGIATKLMLDAINLCKTIRIHGKIIVCTNHNSEEWVGSWYEKLGFKPERLQASLETLVSGEDWVNVYSMNFGKDPKC